MWQSGLFVKVCEVLKYLVWWVGGGGGIVLWKEYLLHENLAPGQYFFPTRCKRNIDINVNYRRKVHPVIIFK